MRTVLIGAVGSTAAVLAALVEAGHPPALIVTLPPEAGRKTHSDYVDLRESSVQYVERTGEAADAIRAVDPDHIFVVGWSQLVGPEIRKLARGYCIGYHPTALPQLRGRAPIGWTILAGLTETGSTLFVLGDDADTGPILAQRRFELDARETVATLIDKHLEALRAMTLDLLPRLNTVVPIPQPETGVSYGCRRTADDSCIDWTASREEVDRLVRASSRPYGGAFTFTSKRRVTVWCAEPVELPYPVFAAPGQVVTYLDSCPVVRCGDGAMLRLTETDTDLVGQVSFLLDRGVR